MNAHLLARLLKQRPQNSRIPLLIAATFGLLSLVTLIHWWDVFKLNRLNSKPSLPTHTTQPLRNIADNHLFGSYKKSLTELPQTPLKLTLEGTMIAVDKQQTSYALISSADKPTKPYQTGQALSDGTVIKKILNDRIILDNDGQLEELRLPIKQLNGAFRLQQIPKSSEHPPNQPLLF